MKRDFYISATDNRGIMADRIWSVIEELPLNKRFRVEICDHRPTRSDQQNKYLWGVVYPAILAAGGELLAGWEAEELHEYCLGEHFGWEIIAGFGVKRRRPIRRSSKLNKQEFADYVAFIQRRMAEHGIWVPDPNEIAACELLGNM